MTTTRESRELGFSPNEISHSIWCVVRVCVFFPLLLFGCVCAELVCVFLVCVRIVCLLFINVCVCVCVCVLKNSENGTQKVTKEPQKKATHSF